MDRKQETTVVKRALIQAGFSENNVRVKHGHGTAWGWLSIHADIHRAPSCSCGAPDEYGRRETCKACKDKWRDCFNRIKQVAAVASERSNWAKNCINVHLDFKEANWPAKEG